MIKEAVSKLKDSKKSNTVFQELQDLSPGYPLGDGVLTLMNKLNPHHSFSLYFFSITVNFCPSLEGRKKRY